MIWEIKCNWGFGGHCEPVISFIEGPGGKALEKFTVFLEDENKTNTFFYVL